MRFNVRLRRIYIASTNIARNVGEHDGKIKNFRAAIFFSKWLPYCEISTWSNFNEKLVLEVIWCGEHDGIIEIVFWATIFCPRCSANNGILLRFGSQVSDSGSWEPLVVSVNSVLIFIEYVEFSNHLITILLKSWHIITIFLIFRITK